MILQKKRDKLSKNSWIAAQMYIIIANKKHIISKIRIFVFSQEIIINSKIEILIIKKSIYIFYNNYK